jgi:enamine deaminase RidA (YjgF/YER057c/UK114 family)
MSCQKEGPVPTKKRFLNPDGLNKPAVYSQVVEVTTPGRLVFIAGQTAIDREGKLVSRDFRAQAVQVFENLKAALAAVGAGFSDIVKLNSYIIEPEHQPILREVRANYMKGGNLPASTSLCVRGFPRDGVLLEIEAIAVLPE